MSEDKGRKFDLNMEEVLEAWGIADATREVIANTLDEQALTGTDDIEIYEDEDGRWHIRDFGRGLYHNHLTQNENEEKLNNPNEVIGKFGVGLKDALATFYRNGVEVTIHSEHETITFGKAPKADFGDIQTLHGFIYPPEKDIVGTDVILEGITEKQIEQAKSNFLRFTNEEQLEKTMFGEVYDSPIDEDSRIYVTGLKVATEPEFLFSYNITRTTKQVRDALNRERSNVGRTAYRSRVQDILQECNSVEVVQRLVEDFENFTEGTTHDEVGWKPIQLHAVKVRNAQDNVVFATVEEQQQQLDLLDHAERDGHRVITVPKHIRDELSNTFDTKGNQIRNVGVYSQEYNKSHKYRWVTESDMTNDERRVWNLRDDILGLLKHRPPVDEIRVSETIRMTKQGEMARGVWENKRQWIVIRRDRLQSPHAFASTLLHEIAHPRSGGAPDLTRSFENALTELLGEVAESAIEKQ